MTLLELLRQELPKRGGWPEGANECVQDCSGVVKFFDSDNLRFDGDRWVGSARGNYYCNQYDKIRGLTLSNDYATAIVTREQYGWDGTGLPPVGVECEYRRHKRSEQNEWFNGVVKYASEFTVVIQADCYPGETVGHPINFEFRPLRTEAERAIDEMVRLSGVSIGAAKILYDAGYRKG